MGRICEENISVHERMNIDVMGEQVIFGFSRAKKREGDSFSRSIKTFALVFLVIYFDFYDLGRKRLRCCLFFRDMLFSWGLN